MHLFVGKGGKSPFSDSELSELSLIGCSLCVHKTSHSGSHSGICLSTSASDIKSKGIDGVIDQNTLFISNTGKIMPSKVLVVRKRMGIPLTTPVAIARM